MKCVPLPYCPHSCRWEISCHLNLCSPPDTMALFLAVFKTFLSFIFRSYHVSWCGFLLLIGLSRFVNLLVYVFCHVWEILWHKFFKYFLKFPALFILCFWNFDDRNVSSVFVTVLQVPMALFLSFLVFFLFCSYWVNSVALSSISLFCPLLNSVCYWTPSVRF